jgi:FAD/FMN-containing dehydrogenase
MTTPHNALDALEALETELLSIVGDRGVTTQPQARARASIDGSGLSPIIAAKLPLGLADIVVFPAGAGQIAEVVAAAARHRVNVTVRGKGTGNYGQGIPMRDGLVVDVSRARAIVEVGDGYLIAEAGATMVSLEQAANATGQQLWIHPSTVQSSIGGFLSGGSGGTGSIKNGSTTSGFVSALDVVHATGDPSLVPVVGAEAAPYIHTYGTAGVIARARVRLEPLQDWRGLYASFDVFSQLLSVIRPLVALEPTPRLISGDGPLLAGALPADPAIVEGRVSLRAIVDGATIDAATELVVGAGGRVEAVRGGLAATMKISMLSYNHPIEWLQKAHPGRYFHLEVGGDALLDNLDEVLAVYDGGLLHLEAQAAGGGGMLVGRYQSEEQVYGGFDRLAELGVGVHSPHHWQVDHQVELTQRVAAATDPFGLLNPGKLPAREVEAAGSVATGG